MRVDIKSSTKRLVASKVTIAKRAVVILTEDERIDIPIPDGIPDGVELPPVGTVLKDVLVSTDAAGDILYGMYPVKGTHIVVFSGFAHGKGQLPAPKSVEGKEINTKDGKHWYKPAHQIFTALLRVVHGPYKGCVIPWVQDYLFAKDSAGNVRISGGQASVSRVIRFLELCGFDIESEIPYSDNILPDLEAILSETADDHPFQVLMGGNGYISEMSELPAGLRLDFLDKPEDEGVDDEDVEEYEEPRRERPHRAFSKDSDDDDEDEDEDDLPVDPSPRRTRRAF